MKTYSLSKIALALFMGMVLNCSDSRGQGVWSRDTSTGFWGSEWAGSCVVDGKIYVGGESGYCSEFDPLTHTWSQLPTVSAAREWEAPTISALNGKIYLIGDYNQVAYLPPSDTTVWVFDPSMNEWRGVVTIGSFTRRGYHAASVVDGKIYVIGGDTHNSQEIGDTVQVFDPATNTWSSIVTTGPYPRSGDIHSIVIDGKIFVLGGHLGNDIYIFDPKMSNWTLANPTNQASRKDGEFGVAVLDKRIYVFGGNDSEITTENRHLFVSAPTEIFDLATNKWSTPVTSGLFSSRVALSAETVDGKIYAMGGLIGWQSAPNAGNIVCNTVEVFTPDPLDVKPAPVYPALELAPNPTSGIVSIYGGPDGLARVTVLNSLGQNVLESTTAESAKCKLDLSKLPSGTYFVRIATNGSVVMKPVVKE